LNPYGCGENDKKMLDLGIGMVDITIGKMLGDMQREKTARE
jgi:hypothetical protein